MGCDGGTIPRRDELVRVKKKPEQKDKDSEREFRWLHCALTQQRLQEPIVMCGLGRLYSKQNVIEQLLEKDKMPDSAKHIKSMKDIRTLNLTPNPAFTEEDKAQGLLDTRHAPYICKLIGLEMSGKFRFVGLWSCGCVVSERALKQIKTNGTSVCPLCQTAFNIDDVVVLNGTDEDVELMEAKIEMRHERRKSAKKDKKEKAKIAAAATATMQDDVLAKVAKEALVEGQAEEQPTTSAESTSGHPAVISKLATNGGGPKVKLFANPKRLGASDNAMQDPDLKRLKTDYSVAKDPRASDVYKSLFTSHESEQQQTRAHWVTYNPFYN